MMLERITGPALTNPQVRIALTCFRQSERSEKQMMKKSTEDLSGHTSKTLILQ